MGGLVVAEIFRSTAKSTRWTCSWISLRMSSFASVLPSSVRARVGFTSISAADQRRRTRYQVAGTLEPRMLWTTIPYRPSSAANRGSSRIESKETPRWNSHRMRSPSR
jgi:hypothetical protein